MVYVVHVVHVVHVMHVLEVVHVVRVVHVVHEVHVLRWCQAHWGVRRLLLRHPVSGNNLLGVWVLPQS